MTQGAVLTGLWLIDRQYKEGSYQMLSSLFARLGSSKVTALLKPQIDVLVWRVSTMEKNPGV